MEEFTADISKDGYATQAIARTILLHQRKEQAKKVFSTSANEHLVKTSTSSRCRYRADSARGMSA